MTEMTKWSQYFSKKKRGQLQAALLWVNCISISEILTGRQMRLQPVPDVLIDRLAHEILNEGPMRQTVYEDIWHWLEPHLPTR